MRCSSTIWDLCFETCLQHVKVFRCSIQQKSHFLVAQSEATRPRCSRMLGSKILPKKNVLQLNTFIYRNKRPMTFIRPRSIHVVISKSSYAAFRRMGFTKVLRALSWSQQCTSWRGNPAFPWLEM